MSEYQYYEFQALDPPLSREEMQTPRGFSSRAQITPTSFVNEYSFGSFKGNEVEWMAKYFDAFLSVATLGLQDSKTSWRVKPRRRGKSTSNLLPPELRKRGRRSMSACRRNSAKRIQRLFKSFGTCEKLLPDRK